MIENPKRTEEQMLEELSELFMDMRKNLIWDSGIDMPAFLKTLNQEFPIDCEDSRNAREKWVRQYRAGKIYTIKPDRIDWLVERYIYELANEEDSLFPLKDNEEVTGLESIDGITGMLLYNLEDILHKWREKGLGTVRFKHESEKYGSIFISGPQSVRAGGFSRMHVYRNPEPHNGMETIKCVLKTNDEAEDHVQWRVLWDKDLTSATARALLL